MSLEVDKKREKKNYIKYVLAKSLEQVARVFSVGTVIQTFMMEYGIGESNTALYSSIVQIANAIMIFAMIFFAKCIKREKLALTVVALSGILAPTALLIFSIFNTASVEVAFFVIAIVSLIINLMLGVQSVLSYTFPYKIIDMKNYGKFAGLTSAISYPASLLAIFLMTYFSNKFEYFSVMTIFFIISIIAWFFSAGFLYSIKENKQISTVVKNEETSGDEKFNVFKYKPTYWLMLPNLLRGFAVGVIGQLIVFGYHDKILDSSSANWVTFLYYAGIMISNFIYVALFKKRNTPLVMVILATTVGFLMPLIVITGKVLVFLGVYFLMYTVLGIFDTMLPVTITKIFPYEGMGTFTAIRMFLMSVGTAIPGLIFDLLYSVFNTVQILMLGGGCLIACAVIYSGVLWFLTKKRKDQKGSIEEISKEGI